MTARKTTLPCERCMRQTTSSAEQERRDWLDDFRDALRAGDRHSRAFVLCRLDATSAAVRRAELTSDSADHRSRSGPKARRPGCLSERGASRPVPAAAALPVQSREGVVYLAAQGGVSAARNLRAVCGLPTCCRSKIGPQGMERLRAFRKIANQHVGFVVLRPRHDHRRDRRCQGARAGPEPTGSEARDHQAALSAGRAGEVHLRLSADAAALSRVARAEYSVPPPSSSELTRGLRSHAADAPHVMLRACGANQRPRQRSARSRKACSRRAARPETATPQSTPKSGIRNVTVSARAGPMSAISRK